MATGKDNIKYLSTPAIATTQKKYCRFKKLGIRY